MLTQAIPIRTGATSVYPYSEALDKLFMVEPKYSEPFSMAKRVGNTLEVPRGLVPVGKEDYRVKLPPLAIDCQMPPQDDEQAACITKSIALLKQGINHVMEAPTGWGKTYGGCAVAAALGQPTLIIVTKEDLLKGWRNTLINLVGVSPLDIGHIQADKCNWKGKKFVLAMVHSLVIEGKYDPEMFRYFGMVIFDEVHRMAADTFSIAAGLFPAYYRLGLSATPKRKDGKDPVIQAHIGQTMVVGKIIPMSPKILVKKTGWRVPACKHTVQKDGKWASVFGVPPIHPGRLMPIYGLMAADLGRNLQIVEFVVASYKAGRRVVVMADLLDKHLVPLFHLLAKAGIPGEKMGYYTSGQKEAALEANANKPIILATYKMCSEGTNYPNWDTLVMATPHADVKQVIGRIMRKVAGKKTPVVLDLVDSDGIFGSFYLSRQKQYYEVKAEIVRM